MASDFLKRKAREQAEQGIRTGTTVEEKEDGTMPSSDQKDQYISTRASSFLSKKAEEQAASVTQRYGEDAYGGSKWHSENSALSTDSLSQLLSQVQGLKTTGSSPDILKTSGGFYSRQTDGGDDLENIYGKVTYLPGALREYGLPLESAVSELKQAESNLKIIDTYLERAKQTYEASPTQRNADVYNQISSMYTQAYQDYTGKYDTYSTTWTKYKTVEDQVGQIMSAYQKYTGDQQKAFDHWRSSIRDAAAIQQELDAINAQIKKLEREDKLTGFGAFVSNAAENMLYGPGAPGGTHAGSDHSDQIRKLKQMQELLQEELDWSQYYYYGGFADASDFAEMSRYVPQKRTERRAMDIMMDNYSGDASGWEDPLYEYINGNKEAGAYISNAAANNYGTDNAIGAFFGRATENKAESQQMTEQEVATFNYLYATQGKAAAHAYYDYLLADLNYRERKEQEKYWEKYSKENPAAASVFSVAMSPMKGLSYLGQAADLASDGEIDANAAYNKFSYVPSSIRSEVARTIEDSGKWGSVGSFAYQTGLSMADFLFATGISGGNSALAMTIMGSGAAADTTLAATERGVEGWKAFTLGTLAGAAEAFTERFSIETLLNPKMLKNGTLKYILKNMIAEGAEEGASDLINLFCDILIAGDQSEWQQSINAYMADGMTEQAAFLAAFKDQALTVGLDILGGAISGGILSSGNAMIQNNSNRWLAKKYDLKNVTENEAQEIIDSGLESGQDTESYQIAQQLQEKLDSGKIPTADELSRLLWATEQAIQMEENQSGYDGIDDNDPDWIALPTVEDDSGVGNSVTDQQQNVTDGDENVIALQNNVPLSIAEQIRQNQNGGTRYENTQRAAGSATSRPAAETNIRRGAGLSDGIEGRNAGTGTAEQTGILASSPEQRRSAYADRNRATVARQNYARSLRLEKVSSLDLGLQNGTEARNIQVMPQESWDAEMSQLADRIYNETGKSVTYVMGRIQIRGTGGAVGYARGVITGDRIIVQADHLRIPMEQIADHEAYHAKVDFTDGRLNDEIRRYIVETFSEEQFRQVLDKYIVGLRGVIDVNETHTGAEFEAAVRQIEEEIFADAYAGINAFGAGADQFTDAVNERMDQLNMGKIRNQDNGTVEATGPPAERFSTEEPKSLSLPTLEDAREATYEGRSLVNDSLIYTYDFMTSQPAMKPIELPEVTVVRNSDGKIDTVKVQEHGMKNALSVGTERDGRIHVKNRYTGREVWVTSSAIRHGLNGAANRLLTNARLGTVIGEIVQNAIPINALHDTADGVDGTYAMAGYAFDNKGREFVTIVTIEQRTNTVADISSYDMTHAISGRQKRSNRQEPTASIGGSQADTKSQGFNLIKASSGISIADLLSAVKEVYQSILSDDVLSRLGETRNPKGHYSGRTRYSYAGENANNADLDALARAKEMQAAGVADETIRQQTGWHTGMDGKWRWEIDDSGMQYHKDGDAMFSKMHPEYARHQELIKKFLYGELTVQEEREFRELDDIWGNENQRLRDRVRRGNAQLQNIIRHEELFDAYPQLRKTRLRFAELGIGTRGQYDPGADEIVLSESLRNAPEDTLIREIQHAIQNAEGFNMGASAEYWERVQKGGQPIRANDRRIAEAERRIQEIMDSLPPFVAGQFELHRHLEKLDPDKAMELADALSEGPYGDEFGDFFLLTWDLDMAAGEDNYIRGAGDLYRNTAGEIEARDAASRRQLTAEQRRNTAPARADDHTVFVEDVDDLSLQLGDRFSVDDADDQVAIGDLQAELYQLQHQRRSLLEADTAYAAAADNLRYANTFTEKVAARKAMAAAAANIDTAAIDQRISDLNEQISEIRNRETRRHREDQEKYSGTKTAGYSTMPDTRLKDLDQDYMKAVRSGDRTRMAELVEQAAEAAMPASVVRDKSGRLLKTYHHTGNRFTVFDRNMARTGTEMDGFFFAPDPDSTSEYGSNMITAYLNITKLAMDPKLDRKFNDSGTLLREKLAYQGYDGVARTENGEIYEYVTFDPEQIKSADPVVYDDRGRVVPLSERFNFRNPDIRYSVDDEGSQQDQEQKPAAPKKKIRPVAESRPLIAKKDLRNTVLNLFSIPNGQRAEVGAMIDSYADRLIKNGSLTEDDRKAFFDRMYDAGVMVMPAEEYSAFARSHIVDGRIYVSDSVKSDFGDDWADIRRRAFAAGVYLVNDRSASGIDQWNATLSAEDMLPGLFDSEETDERTILERILQVAEEGKDEHLSLAEYTRRLSQQEGISEDEFLDNMERQLDWALRTFAEKARLEVHLRDRTGRKIAQEREKGAERMTRQQAKEAQRRADERQARKDSARRAKERRELRELQQRTLKQLQWLSKNRNRAPEELQATWDEVLGDIDIYAISAADEMRWSDKHNATWKDLVEMYDKAKAEDPNFFESKELERFVARLRYKKLEDLDIDALDALYKLATGLRTKFYNQKNVINDEMQRLFAEVYTDSKREIESAPGENSAQKGKVSGWADKFLNMDQLTPMNVLQRMAGWDPDGAFYSMAKQLERGERDMRAYSVKAQKMLQDFLTEHEDWVKKADGQGKDGLWYKIEIPELVALELGKTPQFGGTIEVWMTPMQKIHMYLESKNQDNLRHMTGGRTFADKQIYSEGKRQEAFAQGKTVRMAPETVKAIVKDLTAEEMELAQILDRYYNTFATQEINKVSNILYGYDKAMGKNYAPIYTNQNYTKTEFGVFDTTAEGVGNLKGRQYAVNPSYNISAFDAFERHVDQTARFCGMAIPARNWTNLMNWREKNNSTGDVITHKWGEEGKRYITDLITTLQAGDDAKSDTISSGLSKLQSNYITAIFGANPSIVLKQLGSIPLAGAYLDARNMPTPAQISKIDRSLISKYTQELEWRTMGYATPETKQLKDNPNWTQTNKTFKFVFGGGAITAMDGWAASTLWPWAENKVRREHPELAVGTKAQIDAGESAFYKKVAEEFEIAVSRSQSVSDEIHQGTLRKSKNPITKAFTMFRSDSAQTYNALRQKIGEARYYMRTGAKEKVVQTAKKAAGTAFVAMLLNAAWSEAISFLMALWKNKGKYYRDDEDELTLQSVAGEMVSNMLGSYAGAVTGGEELFELIGNIITGDTWYGIETPGMEQLNDLLDTLIESGSGMRDLVAGGWDVLKNGGNLGDYFSKHRGEMLGGIKDLAKAAAMYLSGMPASNLEAYLTGAMKWISPELGAAYDDLFSDTGKSDLAGMEGSALEGRIGRILSDRNVSESDDTSAALAALYEAGYKTAIPSDTPTSVSIDGEKHSLGDYQQQAYDTIWGGIVADALDDIVASDSFKEADLKTQAKMLSNLYTYAAEQAKAELFDEYELDSVATKNAAIVAAGATVAECITWNTITSEMKSSEKSAELASWDIPEEAKREIFRCKISDSREDSIAAFDEAGLSFDQFLQAYSMYGQINNEDLKAGMKAVEFSHWVNAQDYTAEQAAVVKDELTYFNMTPASSSRYDELVGAGMDPDEAYDLTGALNELQPEDGTDEVSDLQKWRASVDFSDDVEDQLVALSAVMSDAQFQKVEIANNFGVSPDAYVTLQEIKPQYDADGNGSYKNAEIKAAVDGLPGYYTTEQKAVLWQLATGSTSSRNNPYSRQVGQQVLDARAAAKEAAAQEQTDAPIDSTDDDSFSQALLDQLLGRG